jgi:hypothetical protein
LEGFLITFTNGEINAPIKYPGAFTISKNSPNKPMQIQLIGKIKLKAILFFIGK